MSFPPGTEMFQFPGFASPSLFYSTRWYPSHLTPDQAEAWEEIKWWGWVSPFRNRRIKACSQLPDAYRSVPRLSSPVHAKAFTNCPYLTFESPHHQWQCWYWSDRNLIATRQNTVTALVQNNYLSQPDNWIRFKDPASLRLQSILLSNFMCDSLVINDDIGRTQIHTLIVAITASIKTHSQCQRRGQFPQYPCRSRKLVSSSLEYASSSTTHKSRRMVEPNGFEPLTPCLQSRCSTNWAKAPR